MNDYMGCFFEVSKPNPSEAFPLNFMLNLMLLTYLRFYTKYQDPCLTRVNESILRELLANLQNTIVGAVPVLEIIKENKFHISQLWILS